jgi:hypothetical protein
MLLLDSLFLALASYVSLPELNKDGLLEKVAGSNR